MDAATQIWMVMKKSTNLKLKTWFLAWKECENSHTLTTTAMGSKNSQKEVNSQIDLQKSVPGPQRSLLYRLLVLFEVKCKTHTQQQRPQFKTYLRLVNLTENAAQHTFKAPCCCFDNAPNTDLLFFEQSK